MMRVFHKLDDIRDAIGTSSVAIGNFDGCHLGHAKLLEGMVRYANAHQDSATVLTFFPHPGEVIKPSKPLQRLMTAAEKLSALEGLGVDLCLVATFDSALAQMTPTVFFKEYLQDSLRARSIHVGFNFMFGKGRAGNADTLRTLAEEAGIEVCVLEPFERHGMKVSSSTIRQLLEEGRTSTSSELLGRPYTISGLVSKGEGRGHGLGFPTANLHVPHDKVIPKHGVYVTRALWQKQWFRSVTNVGVRPTFQGTSTPSLVTEVHLLDFQARLYDEPMTVEFFERIRDEIRFGSPEELRVQIQKDVERARSSPSLE